jgi:peptide-methionine (S)-S-oxide reductase
MKEIATLGGGCFWCPGKAVYDEVNGVGRNAESGYAGGDASPLIRGSLFGTTGHAGVVQVTFDPSNHLF